MANCENKSIVFFGAVTGNLADLPNTVVDKLSTAQNIFMRYDKLVYVLFSWQTGNLEN